MPFFSDTGPGGFQPKRAFRFLINFTELSGLTFMAKTAAKPSYSMETKSHNVLNHVFNFPGVVKWEPISFTFIDAIDPNVGSKFYTALKNSGYVAPVSESNLITGVTKVASTSALGEVRIQQLDGGGIILPAGGDPGEVVGAVDQTTIVEEWTLKNAFIKGIKFGEGLSYESEDLVEVSCDVIYDYATYSNNPVAYAG